jgi:hypothetical protein
MNCFSDGFLHLSRLSVALKRLSLRTRYVFSPIVDSATDYPESLRTNSGIPAALYVPYHHVVKLYERMKVKLNVFHIVTIHWLGKWPQNRSAHGCQEKFSHIFAKETPRPSIPLFLLTDRHLNSLIFCDISLCRTIKINRHFEWLFRFYLQDWKINTSRN